MPVAIRSLHHVTATVDGAQEDLDFCVGTLALRLVKRTVNFDNHDVFHFYYGDAAGTPGTIWTTFPYRGWGVKAGKKGTGQVAATSFSVPRGSMNFWQERLTAAGVPWRDVKPRFGSALLALEDPSGLALELVETVHDERPPWVTGRVGADVAIRGLHGVTMMLRETPPSLALMTEVLGFRVTDADNGRTRLVVGEGGPGAVVDLVADPAAPPAANGIGTVHHVAFAVESAAAQRQLREELLAVGVAVTEVLDRNYFTSIYFREPGGVLFEVATLGPGFTVDEPLARLGESLKLPAWEEPNREAIEARLPAVVHR